jgi:transposase
LGYKNFYVYGAVSPKTGDSFSLIIPNVDVDWMNKFLEEFSVNLRSRNAILVLDQAGWHKSSNLNIPQNIKIIYLSPYSPELNPVEKLWQFIKDNILKNTIYDTLNDLEEKLCDFINSITTKQILSVCNVSYMPYYL